MTMIAITPEIESALALHAQRRSVTLDEMARHLLRDKLVELEQEVVETADESEEQEEGTLADLLAGHIGIVSGNGTVSARNTGRQFTEILLEKQRGSWP